MHVCHSTGCDRGDFNLIRSPDDKNNVNVNPALMNMFNMFIDLHQFQEIKRCGSKYTWTNKQATPVMKNLDRILMSTEWENKFPLCFAWSKTRVGSDHWPIFLDSGENSGGRTKWFFFEKQWLLEEDFMDSFTKNWQKVRDRFHNQRYSLDIWHGCLNLSRQYLRGWNANKIRDSKKEKKDILQKLEEMDKDGEQEGVNERFWVERYQLEGQLEQLYHKEELFWQ
jgi:hypothetical protein